MKSAQCIQDCNIRPEMMKSAEYLFCDQHFKKSAIGMKSFNISKERDMMHLLPFNLTFS